MQPKKSGQPIKCRQPQKWRRSQPQKLRQPNSLRGKIEWNKKIYLKSKKKKIKLFFIKIQPGKLLNKPSILEHHLTPA